MLTCGAVVVLLNVAGLSAEADGFEAWPLDRYFVNSLVKED